MSPKSPEIARFQAGGDWEGREGERKEGGKRDDAGTFREVSGAKIAPFSPTLSPLLGGNAERGARRGGEGAGGGPEKNPPPGEISALVADSLGEKAFLSSFRS